MNHLGFRESKCQFNKNSVYKFTLTMFILLLNQTNTLFTTRV